ncbi:LexA family transcriptional regulator [Nitratidesulfovibrio vulgaris]|uniref:Peptidase, S24 family n=1 Tax=Nitratidesulfovibrio vulgaris (strain ATCC 29579 / DSM 644 / CCUG 34227 / NCIMB 8303 / VKM B-1760 / Hildenborough) TaxID=882 RepID=Q728B8_NITV2|nr:S24 family peptidase [Nitratidesulfovibrio vulgaris]AAS97158.1 peptidase, S24 family [Nitratidesulfovibrio vulgaris str. Hildenborough]ADP87622.1 putative phage repressor [Nitratidesulfovibrio vulgaris RCH1]
MERAKSFEAVLERLMVASGAKNDSDLARILGITPQSVSGARKRGEVPPVWIQSFAEKTGISSDWLFFGRQPEAVAMEPVRVGMLRAGDPIARVVTKSESAQEEMTPPLAHAGKAHVIECDDCEIMMLPMVEARLSAGNGSFETGANIERRYAFRTDFLLRKGQPSHMVLMRVDGDSMEPNIMNGDVVLIDQSQRDPRAGKVYAVGVEDVVYLKMVNAAPGKIVLSSYNAVYPPLEIDARGDLSNGIRIIGRAVWVGRELN